MATRTNRVTPVYPEITENRDPNNINDHIKVDFYSVLAEPPTGPQSMDCTWECSEIFFNCCLGCWYKIFSLLCGICVAIYWGCIFAPVVFRNVWMFTPLRHMFWVACGSCCKKLCTLCTRGSVKPCLRACGHLFINCGDGTIDRSEDPPVFADYPRRKPQPKQETQPQEDVVKKPAPVGPAAGAFDDYDKEKIKNSVKRSMMMY